MSERIFDDSKSFREARKAIRSITKKDVQLPNVRTDKGDIAFTQRSGKTYNHVAVANDMVKIINTTPFLPTMCRKVMCYRILNPGITDMGIALSMGIRVDSVRQYETEGKNRVAEFMRRTDITEARGRFDVDRVIQNELRNMNKQGTKNALIYDTK